MSKLLIIGAGASTAINSYRFPTMEGFFASILKCARSEREKEVAANFFMTLDLHGVFTKVDANCVALATDWKKHQNTKRDEYLEACQSRFKPGSSSNENLEMVFQKATTVKNNSPQQVLLYMIRWLLGYSDSDIEEKAARVYHLLFDKFITEKRICSIVSFNYDILVDKALITWLAKKKPISGKEPRNLFTRDDTLSGMLNPDDICQMDPPAHGPYIPTPPCSPFSGHAIPGCERLRLLKPHGSLSLTQNKETKETCLLWGENNFSLFPLAILSPDSEMRILTPLIVPPVQVKIKSHPILFEAEKYFFEELKSPNTKEIAIIGWSMPPTDEEYQRKIENLILDRPQLEKLTIVDLKSGDQDDHFDRMEALFRPKSICKWHLGFNESAIHSCF